MNRRTFVGALAGGLLAAPLAAGAQPVTKEPRIGFVEAGSRSANQHFLDAFRQGFCDLRYIEGQTIFIDDRWADGPGQLLHQAWRVALDAAAYDRPTPWAGRAPLRRSPRRAPNGVLVLQQGQSRNGVQGNHERFLVPRPRHRLSLSSPHRLFSTRLLPAHWLVRLALHPTEPTVLTDDYARRLARECAAHGLVRAVRVRVPKTGRDDRSVHRWLTVWFAVEKTDAELDALAAALPERRAKRRAHLVLARKVRADKGRVRRHQERHLRNLAWLRDVRPGKVAKKRRLIAQGKRAQARDLAVAAVIRADAVRFIPPPAPPSLPGPDTYILGVELAAAGADIESIERLDELRAKVAQSQFRRERREEATG